MNPKSLKNTAVLQYIKNIHNEKSLNEQLKKCEQQLIIMNFSNSLLNCEEINVINNICLLNNKKIIQIYSTNAETIVSSTSLGFQSELYLEDKTDSNEHNTKVSKEQFSTTSKIVFHQGTLRSGEIIESDSDLFIIGDVNPGATIKALGNIMIWGRLLGIAHAGAKGDKKAKIAALQLRPVQLRIADKIARGPQEKPEPGFAEEAKIESEMIVIYPLSTI